jgi:hypothetical protein
LANNPDLETLLRALAVPTMRMHETIGLDRDLKLEQIRRDLLRAGYEVQCQGHMWRIHDIVLAGIYGTGDLLERLIDLLHSSLRQGGDSSNTSSDTPHDKEPIRNDV